MIDVDPVRLHDVDAAHAVFAVLARLYGAGAGEYPSERPSTAMRVRPDAAVRQAQQAAEREAARMLLDRLPFGIVVIDGHGRRQLANEAGGRMLEEAAFLRCERDVVTPAVAGDDPLLEELLVRAHTPLPWPPEGVAVLLHRADGRHPVRVLALAFTARDGADRSLVLLLPDEERAHAMRRLITTLFGLTPAEAHLAILMTGGLSLAEAASERGITLNTARTYWHSVMWKVGGGADAPLLALLRSALALPFEAMPGR